MNQRLLNQYFRPMWGLFLEGEAGGGGGGTGGDGGGDAGGEGGTGGSGGEKTHTQADLNAAAGAARKDGQAAAEKKLADELGVPLDEAKALIKAAKDQAESEKSDAKKAQEKAEADSKAATDREAAAAKKEHDLNVRDALRDAEVPSDRVARVATLVQVEVGADEATIVKAVEAVKKEFPELFGGAAGGSPDSDTGGTGGSGGTGSKSKTQVGYEKAQADFGSPGGSTNPFDVAKA